MKDLTRTPTVSSRSDITEVQRWINSIAVRGNFDWMPGVLYTDTLLETLPFAITGSYADIMSISFTPRVRSRVVVTACVDLDATGSGNLVVVGSYCSPDALASSGTDATVATPDDYAREAPIIGGFRHSVSISNSFDLAAGVTYAIKTRVKSIVGSTARVNFGNSMTILHFPMLTPAGQ